MLKGGVIVDAAIINAPGSTKNAQKARDPEMRQTKKGDKWRFGMRWHVGVDVHSGLVHTITATAANARYYPRRPIFHALLSRIDYLVNRRPSSLPHISDWVFDGERHIEYLKSSVRCRAEGKMGTKRSVLTDKHGASPVSRSFRREYP